MGELKRRGHIWWIRYHKNGKRHEESSGSTKEGEAKGLLRLREGDIERGVGVTPKVGRIRFDEAVTHVLNDYRTNRKRSLDDVERRIEKHLKPFFGNFLKEPHDRNSVLCLLMRREPSRSLHNLLHSPEELRYGKPSELLATQCR